MTKVSVVGETKPKPWPSLDGWVPTPEAAHSGVARSPLGGRSLGGWVGRFGGQLATRVQLALYFSLGCKMLEVQSREVGGAGLLCWDTNDTFGKSPRGGNMLMWSYVLS